MFFLIQKHKPPFENNDNFCMVSIFAKACICLGNTQVHLQFLYRQMDLSSASNEISFHGLPSKSKLPSIRKHSVFVIITAICRDI